MLPKKISVVIPIFNGWSHVEACLKSCAEHISDQHEVIILDDSSDEPGMEEKIKNAIAGLRRFKYFRQKKNTGFVKVCNHAVFNLSDPQNDILILNSDTVVTAGFLEEMSGCLYLSERHGVCSPRSDSATICTIPVRHTVRGNDFQRVSHACFLKMKEILPKYSVIPTGVGFCMLIKRELIDRFGFFDERYGKGYNEENDFCSRINRFGYSAIMANRAFVFHAGGASFQPGEKKLLERHNRRALFRKYPEYARSIRQYFEHGMPACERFADLIGGCYPRKKILIDLSHLVAAYNGTSEYALNLLKELKPALDSKFDVTILVTKRAAEFFGLSQMYPGVRYSIDEMKESFDLVFVPQQIFSMKHLAMLNRIALKIIFNMQDIIALRCSYLSRPDMETAVRWSAFFADGIISVSHSSLEDLRHFLPNGAFRPDQCQRVIYHAYPGKKTETNEAERLSGLTPGFVFLVGNGFHHKSVAETLEKIRSVAPIAVLGDMEGKDKNLRFFRSGFEPGRLIRSLYDQCSVVVFPSQYEGFGLPFLMAAARGKPVVAFDSKTTREIIRAFALEKLVYLFRNFSEIPGLIAQARGALHEPPASKRTWRQVAGETMGFIETVLKKPVNPELLDRKFRIMDSLERVRHENDFKNVLRTYSLRPFRFVVRVIKRAAEPVLGLFGK